MSKIDIDEYAATVGLRKLAPVDGYQKRKIESHITARTMAHNKPLSGVGSDVRVTPLMVADRAK